MDQPTPPPNPSRPPALTINIQSWATPVVAIVALLLGLLGGYFGRPLLNRQAAVTPEAEAAPQAAVTQPVVDEAQRAEMMQQLVSQTRHFKGDPDAPVTIIEFSDFQ